MQIDRKINDSTNALRPRRFKYWVNWVNMQGVSKKIIGNFYFRVITLTERSTSLHLWIHVNVVKNVRMRLYIREYFQTTRRASETYFWRQIKTLKAQCFIIFTFYNLIRFFSWLFNAVSSEKSFPTSIQSLSSVYQ